MPDPVTIAVVSGKGGVGKTMLSVAVANELAKAKPTLLIDLDFFNRGLTGLMATLHTGKAGRIVAKPSFLAADQVAGETAPDVASESQWRVYLVAKNLYHVSYPDLTESDIRKSEIHDIEQLTSSLSDFIRDAATAAGCDCVVLDCHGGPDNSSFAACLVADHSLLVSEPDRITLFGTLNFLRQFWGVAGKRDANIHLVFNKVVPAFSATFLIRFYDRHLRNEFNGRPLLAICPLEVHLTKEFEKTPFLTSVYPTSLLARKTRILLYDLLIKSAPDRLTPRIRSMSRFYRFGYRISLGQPFFLFDLNFIMATIVASVIASAALIFFANSAIVDSQTKEAKIDLFRLVVVIGRETKALNESEIVAIENAVAARNDRYWDYIVFSDALNKLLPLEDGAANGAIFGLYGLGNLSDVLRIGELLAAKYPAFALSDANRGDDEPASSLFSAEIYLISWIDDSKQAIVSRGIALIILALLWFVTSLLLNWHRRIEIRFTYYFRRGAKFLACLMWIALIGMWWLPAMAEGNVLHQLAVEDEFSPSNSDEIWIWPMAVFGLGVIIYIAGSGIWRGIRDLWYDARILETLLRLTFACYLAGAVALGWFA